MKLLRIAVSGVALCSYLFLSSATSEIIGISFPFNSNSSWQKQGQFLQNYLEDEGYAVSYMQANSVKTQIKDIKTMIEGGCDILVVASIDDKALSGILEEAKNKNVTVISYDRLIMNSPVVDYYVTFDHYSEGVKQAQFLVDKFHLDDEKHRLNVEFFSGARSDNVARDIYEGEMSVLLPYFESGILGSLSFETDFNQTTEYTWNEATAQRRLRHVINLSQYQIKSNTKQLDIILSEGPDIPNSIEKTLTREYGYKSKDLPFITGRDCSDADFSQIKSGKLPMCVYKDPQALPYITKVVINRITNKDGVPVLENSSYFNGVENIPTYILPVTLVDKNNVEDYIGPKNL